MTGFLQRSEIWEEYGYIDQKQARDSFNEFSKQADSKKVFLLGSRKYIIKSVEIKEKEYPIIRICYAMTGISGNT